MKPSFVKKSYNRNPKIKKKYSFHSFAYIGLPLENSAEVTAMMIYLYSHPYASIIIASRGSSPHELPWDGPELESNRGVPESIRGVLDGVWSNGTSICIFNSSVSGVSVFQKKKQIIVGRAAYAVLIMYLLFVHECSLNV